MQEYISEDVILSEPLNSLELWITTVQAEDGNSNDHAYVNVVFADGTRLFEPYNFKIDNLPKGPDPKKIPLPVPPKFPKTLRDVAGVYLRKDSAMGRADPVPPPPASPSDPPVIPASSHGRDGWFLGSALLFANGNELPLLGMSQINQFLDDDQNVLMLTDWSTRSSALPRRRMPSTRLRTPAIASWGL